MKDGMKADNLRVKTLVADSTNAGAGEIGTAELAASAVASGNILAGNVTTAKLADNSVDAAKLAVSYNVGHFTLGSSGAEKYVGFSGAGVAVTMDGSPLAITFTPFADSAAIDELPFVVDYSTSGFNASGAAALVCMYHAFEEG